MRYHNITTDDMLNGDGLRTVLWVAGCSHHCRGCHNPDTWDIDGGIPFDSAAMDEITADMKAPHISGITFSGGDPLHPQNREEIGRIIYDLKEIYPEKSIWLYTGYEWDEIKSLSFIGMIDVIVDGEYKEELRNINLAWRGSSNQHVINVRESLRTGSMVLWCD